MGSPRRPFFHDLTQPHEPEGVLLVELLDALLHLEQQPPLLAHVHVRPLPLVQRLPPVEILGAGSREPDLERGFFEEPFLHAGLVLSAERYVHVVLLHIGYHPAGPDRLGVSLARLDCVHQIAGLERLAKFSVFFLVHEPVAERLEVRVHLGRGVADVVALVRGQHLIDVADHERVAFPKQLHRQHHNQLQIPSRVAQHVLVRKHPRLEDERRHVGEEGVHQVVQEFRKGLDELRQALLLGEAGVYAEQFLHEFYNVDHVRDRFCFLLALQNQQFVHYLLEESDKRTLISLESFPQFSTENILDRIRLIHV